MTRVDNTRTTTAGSRSSLVSLVKMAGRLVPRQINDELSLAAVELKGKGVKVGVAAALLAVALVFVAFMVIALLVAAIMGLGEVMEPWLAALLVALLFLVLAAIVGLIGALRLKKTMPLLPEHALWGIKYDIGVLKEGRSFDPATLDQKPVKKEKPEQAEEDQTPKQPAPSLEELRNRSGERREHLARIRDGLGEKLDPKPQSERIKANASEAAAKAREAAETRIAAVRGSSTGSHAGATATGTGSGSGLQDELQDRWKPLAALAASLAAFFVLLRKLLRQ
ncbi:phage holin family protein [Crystallibacter degradans]|uniref:phage holin family protein n=1 Tax=Crystallibacter degradans TaxID=2726743 RepID=UPI001475F516|nr:phage holin family protein [Arthrobacter sp. SF27]NMR31154.1 phage holin family protein [Arthrobacter sp. SF27]